jgi:hypothetical protein
MQFSPVVNQVIAQPALVDDVAGQPGSAWLAIPRPVS